MDFHFTDEQEMLRKSARDFAKGECPGDFIREMEDDEKGYTTQLWNKMAELGWMGLMLPEDYDGIGCGLLDLVVIMEEIGAGCVPGPYLDTVLGSLAVLEGADDAVKKEILPQVVMGQRVLTLAYLEPGNTSYNPNYVATKAEKQGEQFALNGSKLFVPYADSADYFILSARTSGEVLSSDGLSLFLVPKDAAGITITPIKTIAGDKQAEVVLENVSIGSEALIGGQDQASAILDKILKIGAIAKCAEMVGSANRVLDITVEYTKDRAQFGSLIGRFQAVQHHCANMAMDLHGSRYITYKAAWMLSENVPCDLVVASAKGWISEAYKRISALGHQVGAASAYIVEHDMTLYSRRAKAAELAYGDAAYHRSLAAQALGL